MTSPRFHRSSSLRICPKGATPYSPGLPHSCGYPGKTEQTHFEPHRGFARGLRVDSIELRYVLLLTIFGLSFASSISIAQTGVKPDDGRSDLDTPGLDIQAIAGWDGFVDLSAPVPISFLITNDSEQPLEGVLTLTDSIEKRQIDLGEVFISAHSKRRFSSIQSLRNWPQCIATLRRGGRIYWRRELPIFTGKTFSDAHNYVLFLNDKGRRLQFPSDDEDDESNSSPSIYHPKPGRGRSVQSLTGSSWQMPQHFGALTVLQAIVIPESFDPAALNDAQWEAIAKWVCLGGSLFIHESSETVLSKLKKALPVTLEPPRSIEEMTIHRCGSGSVRIYSGKLAGSDDSVTLRPLAIALSKLSRYNSQSAIDSTIPIYKTKNSEWNRILVFSLFGCYTLLSGAGSLLLFRLSRRSISIYAGTVVAAACVASGVLGGILRSSDGDLWWTSMTQGFPSGIIQLANVEVQSAGGRNSLVTVQGAHVDLQLTESDVFRGNRYYGYYGTGNVRGIYPPFSVQLNQLTGEDNASQIRVPITPWGRRELIASGFDSKVRGLEIDLKYVPQDSASSSAPVENSMATPNPMTPGVPNPIQGRFTVTIKNNLPFDIKDSHLIIGRWNSLANNPANIQGMPIQMSNQQRIQSKRVTIDQDFNPLEVQSTYRIGNLPPTQVRTTEASNTRDFVWNQWNSSGIWSGSHSLPQTAYKGATSAWIVGEISRSPILSIDESRSDFQSLQSRHLFLQEIPIEDLPAEWVRIHQTAIDREVDSVLKSLSSQEK